METLIVRSLIPVLVTSRLASFLRFQHPVTHARVSHCWRLNFSSGSKTPPSSNFEPVTCCTCCTHVNENAVHFAQSLRYQPFSDTDFDFHEIIVGPLNAGPFNRPDLDETFSPERLFYYAPEGKESDTESLCSNRCFRYRR